MITNLEQAVLDLMGAKRPITVANVFATYMRIAGHDIEDTEKAVVTFERALDKHVVRPDNPQSTVIAKLRSKYWYNKLGGCGEGECHMCEQCGGMRLPDKRNKHIRIEAANAAMAAEALQPKKKKAEKKTVNGRKKKLRIHPADGSGPSTPSSSTSPI